jgi:hypothetical protein
LSRITHPIATPIACPMDLKNETSVAATLTCAVAQRSGLRERWMERAHHFLRSEPPGKSTAQQWCWT